MSCWFWNLTILLVFFSNYLHDSKFCSTNCFVGFSTLHSYAWNNSNDCHRAGTSDGWGSGISLHFPCLYWSYLFDVILTLWALYLYEQGDKAQVIQSLLFTSGVNTLLQTLFGTRLPTVMGPSFAYIISALSVINDLSDSNFRSEHEVTKFIV